MLQISLEIIFVYIYICMIIYVYKVALDTNISLIYPHVPSCTKTSELIGMESRDFIARLGNLVDFSKKHECKAATIWGCDQDSDDVMEDHSMVT